MPKDSCSKVAWAGRTNPTVFRQPSLRAAFLAVAVVALTYAAALLAVLRAYRRGYGIVGKA